MQASENQVWGGKERTVGCLYVYPSRPLRLDIFTVCSDPCARVKEKVAERS